MWAERRRTGRGGRRAPFSQHVVLLHSAPLLIKLPLTTKSEATTGHAHYFTRPNGGGCTTQSNKSVCVGGGAEGGRERGRAGPPHGNLHTSVAGTLHKSGPRHARDRRSARPRRAARRLTPVGVLVAAGRLASASRGGHARCCAT